MSIVAKRKSFPAILAIKSPSGRARALSRTYWPLVFKSLRARASDVTEARRITMASAMVVHLGAESGFSGEVYNYNAGNITIGPPSFGWKGDVFISGDSMPVYKDGVYQKNIPITQHFRSYGSLAEGLSDYVGFVKQHTPGAWATLHDGDPADYFISLKKSHYLGGHGETDGQLRSAMAHNFALVDAYTKDLQPTSVKRALGIGISLVPPVALAATLLVDLL